VERRSARRGGQAARGAARTGGLHPERPFLLFTGSTSNITDPGAEDRFVRRWAEAVRTARAPQLREAGLLVRPHPDRRGDWSNIDLEGLEEAVVWPPARPNSVTEEARAEYFDSLYHASVVVGINTSAMVEAAILGRPVLSLRLPEFFQAQRGTLHFAHMLPEHGGFLDLADSLDEHLAQVQEAMDDPGPAQRRNRAFVEYFVRPEGAGVPATPRLVAAIEQLAALAPAPARAAWWLLPLRALLRARAAREDRQEARLAAPLDARLARGRRLVEGLNRVSSRLAPRAPRTARRLRWASKRLKRTLRRRMKSRMREEKLHRASEKRRRRERRATIRSRYTE
jgi:hypothetical protein